ncbi:MAG: amino acid adenylation domain-containing protein [Acidobacteria bacterium]|nr:amino acid adenylation domain-containing protein [Acidobacteriota bacterium]
MTPSEVTLISRKYGKEKSYWANKLADQPGKSFFPVDFYTSGSDNRSYSRVHFDLSGELYVKLMQLSNKSDFRLHMILLSAVVVLLNKYTGHQDIMTGVPIDKVGMEGMEGNLINSVLSIRGRLQDTQTFKELLLQVRETINEAIENQNYPIESLLNDLNLTYTEDEFPLFDCAVLLENIHDKKYIAHIPLNIVFSFAAKDACVQGTVEYNTALYRPETIERIIGSLKVLMEKLLFNLDTPMHEISILTPAEKEKILSDFNATDVEYPLDKTINELFAAKAEQFPGHVVVIYKDKHISYHELQERSGCLAEQLVSKGVQANTIVGIMMERSAEMVVGILGILKAGGAYLPIDHSSPQERIDFMLKDSNAKVLIINKFEIRNPKSETNPNVQKINGPNKNVEDLMVLDFEHLNLNSLKGCPRRGLSCFDIRASNLNSSNLAYIIYTSGTTGKPKGVMIEHRNVINFIYGLNDAVYKRYDMKLNLALVSSFIFDASVQQVYCALLFAHRLYIIPEQERADGTSLLDFYRKHRIDVSDGTPTHLNLMVQGMWGRKLDFSLKHLILGGDVLLKPIVKEFLNGFEKEPPRITNVYGPTECTVNATFYEVPAAGIDSVSIIPIGKPSPNYKIFILDKRNNPAAIGIPGELYISGSGVARGYLNHPELTSDKFRPLMPQITQITQIKEKNKSFCGGLRGAVFSKKAPLIYKTGDLARWLPAGPPEGGASGGVIEFMGRLDHQVKIRGYRIELGEIECALLRQEGIKAAFVTVHEETDGDKKICAYIVCEKKFTVSELRKNLSELPDYMIPSYFMQLEDIPLTASGKVDRKALPKPELRIEKKYLAPGNVIEWKLARIWSEVLEIEAQLIGIESDFFELGGHSLSATKLVNQIHLEFNIRVSLAEIFKAPTIKDFSKLLSEAKKDVFISLVPAAPKDYYTLSSAQKRIFYIQQKNRELTAYNIVLIEELTGTVDRFQMENVFKQLIQRHESLRTSFEIIAGEPMQRINDNVDFAIEYKNAATEGTEDTEVHNFIRPFDLRKAPLLRVGLTKLAESKHILVIDIHHIISDGIAVTIFIKEFAALYAGEELPPLRLQYKDYSEWLNSTNAQEALRLQEEYWLKEFAGTIPELNLPADYPRPATRVYEGNRIAFQLSSENTSALKTLALEEGVTMFMLLLAVYYVFLAKLTAEEDIIVGVPSAGRNHAETWNMIGVFINSLALRNYPSGEKTFSEFLNEIKKNTLMAFDNQDYPFDDIIEKVAAKRDPGRNPLFDVLFQYQNIAETLSGDTSKLEIPGFTIKHYAYSRQTAKFDLYLYSEETEKKLAFSLEYYTGIFKQETVEMFVGILKEIVSAVIENKDIKLKDIKLSHDLLPGESPVPSIEFGF